MFAFTELQKFIADEISNKTGKAIGVGSYVHFADSYHIYGSYFDDFKGFLQTVEKRTFEERVWESEYAEPMFEEAKEKLGEESAR